MKKIKNNSVIIAIIAIIFLNLIIPITQAVKIEIGKESDLKREKELLGLVQIKSNKALKLVEKIYYINGSDKLPAFCVEPYKPGVGETDGKDSYKGTISKVVTDPEIWRLMYGGYLGKKWNETTVENDDDWYAVTKVALHALMMGVNPKSVYEVPTHVAACDAKLGLTLEEAKRRGKKILDECEKLYLYAKNGTDNFVTAKIELKENGGLYESGNYMVQNYTLQGNKEIANYDVILQNFPAGTTYEKASGNIVKVKIPKNKIDKDYKGIIFIANAQVKNYPAFYCEAYDEEHQDYIVIADPYELASTRKIQEVNGHKSSLNIIKKDKEDNQVIPSTVFNIKYLDGAEENLGNYTTDKNGKISISNLRAGKIKVTEVESNSSYILDTTPYETTLEYNSTKNLEINNEHKKGDLKVYKVDKDNNKISLGNVEFDLYSNEYKKVIGTYKTDENGIFTVKNLRTRYIQIIRKEN